MTRRGLLLFATLFVLMVVVGLVNGTANIFLLMVTALCYSLIALGLNLQFGYGGLFNLAIMGLLMVGAMGVTSISMPINMGFWNSEGPYLLFRAIVAAVVGLGIVFLARQVRRLRASGTVQFWVSLIAWFAAYVIYRTQIDPAADYIEHTNSGAGWVGGLGLPIYVGWAVGAALAGVAAYVIGKISLGLRSDYLAIATIGMSEIIRAFIKNMDWLTRGTLTVSPIPWPVPTVTDYLNSGYGQINSFILARGGFVLLMVVLLAVVVYGIERAYHGPWGRMMRAIRDNYIAAGSMGKNVTERQLQLFVLGSVLMGLGGAILASYNQLFDPSGYAPINHTFLIWVMVIVGGAGNSYGALFGGVFVYLVWALSDPVSHAIFDQISAVLKQFGWPAIPDVDSRASQMRVFVLGLVITLALRFAPRGLIPEVIRREK